MTYFLKQGNSYMPTNEKNMHLFNKLPAGYYVVNATMTGFIVTETDEFKQPPKIYGSTLRQADRILSTFEKRSAATGVLLAGEKGSGKTLLARELAIQGVAKDVPCLIVNSPFAGNGFNAFMQNINQPCTVLFDEFEKTYSPDEQASLLTLFDGVFPSKKLFILTCNDEGRINNMMVNRPGRIYYRLDFNGLSSEFVREYCEDNLKAKEYIESIVNYADSFYKFNFDMLKAIIEEMNRYNEPPKQAIEMLNIRNSSYHNDRSTKVYEIAIECHDEKVGEAREHFNPLSGEFYVNIEMKNNKYEEEFLAICEDSAYTDSKLPDTVYDESVIKGEHPSSSRTYCIMLDPTNLTKVNVNKGTIIARKGDFTFRMNEVRRKTYDYSYF